MAEVIKPEEVISVPVPEVRRQPDLLGVWRADYNYVKNHIGMFAMYIDNIDFSAFAIVDGSLAGVVRDIAGKGIDQIGIWRFSGTASPGAIEFNKVYAVKEGLKGVIRYCGARAEGKFYTGIWTGVNHDGRELSGPFALGRSCDVLDSEESNNPVANMLTAGQYDIIVEKVKREREYLPLAPRI